MSDESDDRDFYTGEPLRRVRPYKGQPGGRHKTPDEINTEERIKDHDRYGGL